MHFLFLDAFLPVLELEKCKALLCCRTKIFHLACSIGNKKICYFISDAGVEIPCTEVKCISTDSEGFLNTPEARRLQ